MLSPLIGYNGLWVLFGLLAIPLGIAANGFLAVYIYGFFYYPMKLTRATGKPVYFADYWGGPKKPYPGAK